MFCPDARGRDLEHILQGRMLLRTGYRGAFGSRRWRRLWSELIEKLCYVRMQSACLARNGDAALLQQGTKKLGDELGGIFNGKRFFRARIAYRQRSPEN